VYLNNTYSDTFSMCHLPKSATSSCCLVFLAQFA